MKYDNTIRLVRELKGAPLSIAVAMAVAGKPARQDWLGIVTGYSEKLVGQALDYMSDFGMAAKTNGLWSLDLSDGGQQLVPRVVDFGPRSLREMRGVSLAILVALSLAGSVGVSQEWLERVTGYTDKWVSQQLKYLSEIDLIIPTSNGWILSGPVKQLPLGLSLEEPNRVGESDSHVVVVVESLINLSTTTTTTTNPVGESDSDADPVQKLLVAAGVWPSIRARFLENPIGIEHVLAKLGELFDPDNAIRKPARLLGSLLEGKFAPAPYYTSFRAYIPPEILAHAGLALIELPANIAETDDVVEEPVPEIEPDPSIYLPDARGWTPEKAWMVVLQQLQGEMAKASYNRYVRHSHLVDAHSGLFMVCAQTIYSRDWLESRLSSTISRLLTGILNRNVEVEFITTQEMEDKTYVRGNTKISTDLAGDVGPDCTA